MAARRRSEAEPDRLRLRPASSPEEWEQRLTAAAYALAEEQMHAKTASSQVITHFLKAGSAREQLEQERIAHENQLLQVKREQIESQQRMEEMYKEALDAMRSYSGQVDPEDEPNDED